MTATNRRTFMDEYRVGWAAADDIHDHIDRWHTSHDDEVSLNVYLGLTWDEYTRWGERNELPQFMDNPKACGAPEGSRYGYLPCGCSNDGYGGHRR